MSEEQLIATPGLFGENQNFLLERELGRGGMGGVYMGRDKMLDRPVAVKVMLKEYGSDQEFVEKFKREAQAVARLIHPNIAQVYSYGFSDGMPYIAMELVAGGSLDGLMKTKGKDIDVPRVMKICEQVAQALRCAADQGLVHGDVKPENVLLDANGNAKLVDFGLAAMQKDTSEIWGTPYYIAPEKCKRQPVDYRADMYSLGGTIYHALTGVPPFEGADANEVVKMRFMGMPKKPSEVRPGLSPQIDNLVMTMLALEPTDRFPSFEALLEEFKKVMTTGLSVTSPIIADTATGGAAAAPRKTVVMKGGKKVLLRPKKGFKVKTVAAGEPAAAETPPAADGEDTGVSNEEKPKSDDDEDEEGGNLGLKVLGVVGGVLLFIGLVVGGFFWYIQHSKEVKLREEQAQMESALGRAHQSLQQTRKFAQENIESYEKIAAESIADCEKLTGDVRKLLAPKYSEEIIAMLKPAEPAELIAAREELGKPLTAPPAQEAAAPEPAPAPAPAAEAPAAPAAAGAAPAAAPAAEGAAPAPAPAADAAAPAPAPAAEEAPAVEIPAVVKSVNELWALAYGVQTRAHQIHRKLDLLINEIDQALAIKDVAQMQKVVAAANSLADRYNEITGDENATSVSNDAGKVRSRSKSTLEKETRRMRQLAKEDEKIAKKKEAKLSALRKELAEKEETISKAEAEIAEVKECFASCVDPSSGLLKYFDWSGMRRKLNSLQLESPYAENQRKKELRKVDAFETSQTAMISNMKSFTFARAIRKGVPGIKGGKVEAVDAKNIVVMLGGKKKTITWIAFYRDYHSNLDELIGKFIRGGRQNPKKRLNHVQWVNAMVGTAYTLSTLCSDDETVVGFVEKLVKDAVVAEYRLQIKNALDGEEETPPPAEIAEKDEDAKALLTQIAEATAKLAAIDAETRKVPFYRELFPNIDYDALKAQAVEE